MAATPRPKLRSRAGLEWLKKQQMKDGGWSLTGPYPDGAGIENRCSATAMALLAFQGYGAHAQVRRLQARLHGDVRKGWDYLLKTQNADGLFVHEAAHHHTLYAQAQASIAICEIYRHDEGREVQEARAEGARLCPQGAGPRGWLAL